MNPFSAFPGDLGYVATQEAVEASIRSPPSTCINCPDCQSNFYMVEEQNKPSHSYHHRLSDTEAERRVHATVDQINSGRSFLTERLNTFSDLLMNRWMKRKPDERAALLKEAAPDLDEEQWIIPQYFYRSLNKYRRESSLRMRHKLLVPWLNVAALKANPAILFALLHYRTAYPPQDWAAFDSGQLTTTWAHGWVNVDFSPKCVVMHGQGYGRVVDWNKLACHRADILGFPRAILVLEAQAYLMDTLCRVVEKILNGIQSSQPCKGEKWRNLVTTGAFKGPGQLESWSPYTNQPFSAPPKFDSEHLLSLARSRLAETGDHLWYLQCDAAYLRRHVQIILATENFKKTGDVQRGSLIARHVHGQIMDHYWWRWIEIECKHVDEVRKRFRDSTYPGQPLPKKYDRALGALELLVVNQVIYRSTTLSQLVPFVQGLKSHYSVLPCPEAPHAICLVKRKECSHTKDYMEKYPLDWCLSQICLFGSPDDPMKFDYAMLFNFLEQHLENDPKDKRRLDEIIYQVLSGLSACHQMLVAVRLHRPQNGYREAGETKRTEDREVWKWLRSTDRIKKQDLTLFRRIGTTLVQEFYDREPSNGPKNGAWLAQHQASWHAVEKFWESMREWTRRDLTSSYLNKSEIESLIEVVSANLTPEYLENKKRQGDAILTGPKAPQASHDGTPFFDGADPQAMGEQIIPLRQKTKTRGEPSHDKSALAPTGASDLRNEIIGPAVVGPIAVNKESQHLFRLMFPDKENAGKDVLWDRFVRAMLDAGFVATHSGGSAVSFSKSSGAGGKIVFHRPHPDPKIDPILLRVMGKRMAKHFGWKRDLFVLRG